MDTPGWGQQWDRKDAERRKLSGKPSGAVPLEAPADTEANVWKEFALEALGYLGSELVTDRGLAALEVASFISEVADKLTAEYYGRRAKSPA